MCINGGKLMDGDIYRFQVGAIACAVLRDVTAEPLTQELVESIFVQDSARMVLEFNKLPIPEEFSRNVLYLESAGRRVLIDAGQGDSDPESLGLLLERLKANGIAPESIDTVILTHCHIDHYGGLFDPQDGRSFPNARVVMNRAEYDYWTQESVLAMMKGERAPRLQKTFALYPLEFADDGEEVEPGVRLVAAPGHTPGNLAVLIESQGERLLNVVDVFHMSMQVRVPEAIPRFDAQPEIAVQTRIALLDRATEEQLPVMAYHLTFPGLGSIERTAKDHRKWTPRRDRQTIPDALLSIYDLLTCAFPDGIPDADYWSVLVLIHPYMGSKNFPEIVSMLSTKSHNQVLADTLRLSSGMMPAEADVSRVQAKLDACGYQAWVKKVTS